MAEAKITNLFATLASHLETLNQSTPPIRREQEERSLDIAISELNQSLNLDDDDDSTVKFLDTALSAIGFKAPQVFDLVTEQLVETIVTALSSSIACKVLRFQISQALEIGSSISRRDCAEMITASRDVLIKFEENHVSGRLSNLLLDAVIRTAVSSSWYKYMFPLSPILDAKSLEWRCPAASVLLSHLPTEVCLEDPATPLRLLLWYLDPLILNHDISKILHETTKRPFHCLLREFRERMDWQTIIICLVLSPAMFCETRALLHNWFLKTGLECVLEFMIDLVSVILDIISTPTWWGMAMESGLKLPFSHAYFPFKHHLFQTMAGPISFKSLLSLVHYITEEVCMSPDAMVEMANHRSFWAIAITVPSWFYYAALLLFSNGIFEDTIEAQAPTAASKYIAWILCPFNQTIQETLASCLKNMSESWSMKRFTSDGDGKESVGNRKKLKKPKFRESRTGSDAVLVLDDCHSIGLWLDKFDKIYRTCRMQIASADSMFRRISLGILIGISGELSDGAFELLLHYASTGNIDRSGWIDEYDEDEAVSGACLVFRLTDIVENMSGSLFENEESGSNFVLQFKERTGRYLHKCIKRLLHLKQYQVGSVILSDLHRRFFRWDPPKEFSDIIVELESRISKTP